MAPKKRTRSGSPVSAGSPSAVAAATKSPAAAIALAAQAVGAASPKKYGSPIQKPLATPGSPPPRVNLASGSVDPDLPMTPDGVIYHLACKSADLADKILLVGDPGRVEVVASYFDKNSVRFRGSHREINIATGTFRGVPVSCLSTGMGTDNVEIVMNEIHALKEYDVAKNTWASNKARKPSAVHLIRVGTCGCPRPDVAVGTLAVSNHAIGMDNTCRYYSEPAANSAASVKALTAAANKTTLGKVGVYATKAHDDVVAALVAAVNTLNKSAKANAHQPFMVGTTASGSGFYGCQGRAVGQFRGKLIVPQLVDELGSIEFPVSGSGKNAKTEKVVNIEMENSALCYLSNCLGYKAGTVCAIIARRAGETREFATPDVAKQTLANAITVALNALIAISA